MLKITSSYFLNWKFVPFNAFHLFHKLPLLPPCWSSPVCPLYLWVYFCFQFSSVQSLCRVRLLATPWIAARQAYLFPCPSPTPGVHSESHPLSQWCHPAISSFVVPFSSCPQSLPASESFPMNQLFAWGGQSTGASASFLPKKSQGWSPSERIGWISLQSPCSDFGAPKYKVSHSFHCFPIYLPTSLF